MQMNRVRRRTRPHSERTTTPEMTHIPTRTALVCTHINAKVHKALHYAGVSTAIVEFLIAMQREIVLEVLMFTYLRNRRGYSPIVES